MSEQEQDAIVGRLIREKSQAMRKKAALDAELKMVGEEFEKVFKRLHLFTAEGAAGMLDPIKKYFNTDALLALLKEREETQALVEDRLKQLRDLGVEN